MKTIFEFQYYYRKWLCFLPCFLIIILMNFILDDYIINNMVYYMINVLLMILMLTLYYKITNNMSFFIGKGYYWEDEGIVYIDYKNKVYSINHIKELCGSENNIYKHKYAVLYIQSQQDKIKIFSKPIKKTENFEDSSIYDLYETLLKNNNDLQAVEILHQEAKYWYKNKIDENNKENI